MLHSYNEPSAVRIGHAEKWAVIELLPNSEILRRYCLYKRLLEVSESPDVQDEESNDAERRVIDWRQNPLKLLVPDRLHMSDPQTER